MAQSLLAQDAPPILGPEPLVIPSAVGPLVGFCHHPRGGTVRGIGVVLCNPLGYEAMCAHRAYRHLAERLAARGFPALRFDYQGTGDSCGYSDEPGRVNAWLESIGAAVEELRERTGVRAVALFGVRFGATLAAVSAAKRGDIDSLILWAPSASGRAYVRELRAFRMIKASADMPAPVLDGAEEAAGYRFDKPTISGLADIDLLSIKDRPVTRALLVPRDDIPGDEVKLERHFKAAGIEVRLISDQGYAEMMRDAQETVVPFQALDRMIDWLEEGKHQEVRFVSPPKSARGTLTVTSRGSGLAAREQVLRFGDGLRLFGIASEPNEGLPRLDRPAILFLNVGANHHVGPHRMYVSLGRDLAARGYLGFRFDVAGLGDSQTAPGGGENRLYSKDSVVDVKTAMAFLEDRFGVRRFVLVGLCSGAYLAFHTCVEDSRVVGQVLLNPQKLDWKEGDSLELSMRKGFLSTRYYTRALLSATVWQRALRGEVDVRGVLGVLGERLVARARADIGTLSAKMRGQREPQTEIERAFHTLCGRGVESLLVFSFSDGGIDHIQKHLGRDVRKMRPHRNFRYEIIEEADHTFTPIASQAVLHDLLVQHVTERFS